VNEGIRFKKGGEAFKIKIKHTDEKEEKSNSANSRTRARTVAEPHVCQLSYKASANLILTAAHKKCRNDGSGSLALRRCQAYEKKYP